MARKSIGTNIVDAVGQAGDLAAATREQISQIADTVGGAAIDAKHEAGEVARESGIQLEDGAEKAGHKIVEVTAKVTLAAQAAAQQVIHSGEKMVDAAKHRREERAAKTKQH